MSPAPARPVGPPEHGLGELVWVRLGNYPWWPALVSVISSFRQKIFYNRSTSSAAF